MLRSLSTGCAGLQLAGSERLYLEWRRLVAAADGSRLPTFAAPPPLVQTLNTGSLAWATALFFGYLYMVASWCVCGTGSAAGWGQPGAA